jgi:hypothetical protein
MRTSLYAWNGGVNRGHAHLGLQMLDGHLTAALPLRRSIDVCFTLSMAAQIWAIIRVLTPDR